MENLAGQLFFTGLVLAASMFLAIGFSGPNPSHLFKQVTVFLFFAGLALIPVSLLVRIWG